MARNMRKSVINKVIEEAKANNVKTDDPMELRRSIFNFEFNNKEEVEDLPPIMILENLLLIGCNMDEAMSVLGIGRSKMNRLLEAYGYKGFEDAKKRNFGKLAPMLKAKAIDVAMNGDVQMMKFVIKNVSDWVENPDNSARTITHNIVLDAGGESVRSVNSDKSIEDIISGDIEEDDV